MATSGNAQTFRRLQRNPDWRETAWQSSKDVCAGSRWNTDILTLYVACTFYNKRQFDVIIMWQEKFQPFNYYLSSSAGKPISTPAPSSWSASLVAFTRTVMKSVTQYLTALLRRVVLIVAGSFIHFSCFSTNWRDVPTMWTYIIIIIIIVIYIVIRKLRVDIA